MKKLILSSLIALGMMAFSVNAVASEGASEPTHKCGEGKCGGDKTGKCGTGKCSSDKKDEATSKCGTGKCGGDK
jgi:uncharacterized low-complexity protein